MKPVSEIVKPTLEVHSFSVTCGKPSPNGTLTLVNQALEDICVRHKCPRGDNQSSLMLKQVLEFLQLAPATELKRLNISEDRSDGEGVAGGGGKANFTLVDSLHKCAHDLRIELDAGIALDLL